MSSQPFADRDASPDRLPFVPSLERRRLQFYLLLLLSDGFAIAAGAAIIAYLYLGDPFDPTIWDSMQVLLPLYWTLALANQAYSINALVDPSFALQRMGMALAGAALLQVVLLFLTRSGLQVSRFGFGMGTVLALFLMVWLRANLQPLIRKSLGQRAMNLLLIDDGGPRIAIDGSLLIDAERTGVRPDLADPHTLDRLAQAMRHMDRVVVSCPPERRALWAMALKGGQMQGEIIDGEVDRLGILGTGREGGVGTLVVAVAPLGIRARVLKRLLDLAITVPALLVLAVPLAIVAAAIHLEDGGSVFFQQRRVGRNNRFFWIYKFRSMREASSDAAGAQSASRDDDRITRIGRWLRRTSIDELPQLLNVLRGEMSPIGIISSPTPNSKARSTSVLPTSRPGSTASGTAFRSAEGNAHILLKQAGTNPPARAFGPLNKELKMAEMLDPTLPPEAHNAEQDDAPAQAQTVADEALHTGAQDALNASENAPAPAYDPLAEAGGEPDLVDRMDQMVSSGVIDMDAYRGERNDDDEDMALGLQALDDDFPRGAQ